MHRDDRNQASSLNTYWEAIVKNNAAHVPPGLDARDAEVARLLVAMSPPGPDQTFVDRLRGRLTDESIKDAHETPRIATVLGGWIRSRAIAASLAIVLGLSFVSVGVYAAVNLVPSTPPPAAPDELRIVGQGVDKTPGAAGREVGYAFILQNPSSDRAVSNGTYAVTAYELRGEIIGTSSGDLPMILPDQRLGIGGYLVIDSQNAVDRILIEITTGELVTAEGETPLKTDDVRYEVSPETRVTGIVINPGDSQVNYVTVSAVSYGSDDRIVGGGSSVIATIPGHAQQSISVAITSTESPTRVELYAATAE